MRHDLLAALAVVSLLAGCGPSGGGGSGRVQSTPPPAGKVKGPIRQPVKSPPPVAAVHMVPGLEAVIGANAAELTRQFGPPRLDVWEGDARKLQFSGTPCILDVYLYPSAPGREPQATFVDARRASDGKDVDRANCALALKRR